MMSRKEKLVTSCAVWYGTFTLGLGVSFLGASLLEMSKKFETDVATISKVFSILTISFLAGALICGILFNYINRQILSSLLLIIMGVGTACYPIAPSLTLFFVIAAVVGVTGAGYDTAQIVWIIEMWASQAAPYIQVQHFAFALGALASPLLMKPFLSSDESGNNSNNITMTNYTSILSPEILMDDPMSKSQLWIPFLVGGIVTVVAGIVLLLLTCIMKYEKPDKTQVQGQGHSSTGGDLDPSGSCSKTRPAFLILLSGIFLGCYCGMEMCSIQFLPSYTHFIPLHLSSAEGALVLSGLTGSYTVGRGLGILLVFKIKPEFLLLGNLVVITLGNTVLYFFAEDSLPLLWTGGILLGTGFSTVFPSFYGYIEKHLEVTNVVGAIMIMAGGLVSSLYPVVIGTHIEKDPFVLLYTNYFSLIVCAVAFTLIFCCTRGGGKNRKDEYVLGQEMQQQKEVAVKHE